MKNDKPKRYLVTTRKTGQGFKLGDIEIRVSKVIGRRQVRIAINAPGIEVERLDDIADNYPRKRKDPRRSFRGKNKADKNSSENLNTACARLAKKYRGRD